MNRYFNKKNKSRDGPFVLDAGREVGGLGLGLKEILPKASSDQTNAIEMNGEARAGQRWKEKSLNPLRGTGMRWSERLQLR